MTHGRRTISRRANILSLVSGVLLGSVVIWVSLASYHGIDASDFAAADFSSNSAAAAITASEQHLSNNDPDGAAALARQALAASPISVTALRTEALAEQALGHSRYAAALLSQAAALGWRDLPSQIWLAQAQVASGNDEEAARRLDAALRVSPNNAPLFDIVDGIIGGSHALPEFVQRMTLDPIWRAPYLGYVTDKNFPLRIDMARRLSALHSPPGRKEMLLIIHPLIAGGQVREAREVWFGALGGDRGTLNDPHFRREPGEAAGPFDWSLLSVPGAVIQPNVDGNGGLQVKTDGQASGVVARQLVTLVPGAHRIRFQGTASGAPSFFHWQILCMPSRKVLAAQIDTAGRDYSLVVPSDECSYQTIELVVTSDPRGAGQEAVFSGISLD